METVDELRDRMERNGIDYINPENGDSIMVLQAPKRVLDLENKEVWYYVMIKVFKFDDNGEIEKESPPGYTILDEQTVSDMFRHVQLIRERQNNDSMYV